MIDLEQFDESLVRLYKIIERINFKDLFDSLDNKKLYKKSPLEYQIGDKFNYKELNLTEYQQIVLEKYFNFLEYETKAKVFLTYLKTIEHTVKFIKDT